MADRFALWLGGNLLLAMAVAWVAFQLQQERVAPAILFPLVVGGVLGFGGAAVAQVARLRRTRLAVAGAVAWGLLVVVGQDYIGHRHRLRLYDEELGRQSPAALVAGGETASLRPRFWTYWTSIVRGQPGWWTAELVLTCASAATVTAWRLRKPEGEAPRES